MKYSCCHLLNLSTLLLAVQSHQIVQTSYRHEIIDQQVDVSRAAQYSDGTDGPLRLRHRDNSPASRQSPTLEESEIPPPPMETPQQSSDTFANFLKTPAQSSDTSTDVVATPVSDESVSSDDALSSISRPRLGELDVIYGIGRGDKALYAQRASVMLPSTSWIKVANGEYLSVAVGDLGTIYAVRGDGLVYSQQLADLKLDSSWGSPVAKGKVKSIAVSSESLFAVKDDGQVHWQPLSTLTPESDWNVGSRVLPYHDASNVMIHGDYIYLVKEDFVVYRQVLNSMTINSRWEPTSSKGVMSIAASGDTIFGVLADDFRVHSQTLSMMDAISTWSVPLSSTLVLDSGAALNQPIPLNSNASTIGSTMGLLSIALPWDGGRRKLEAAEKAVEESYAYHMRDLTHQPTVTTETSNTTTEENVSVNNISLGNLALSNGTAGQNITQSPTIVNVNPGGSSVNVNVNVTVNVTVNVPAQHKNVTVPHERHLPPIVEGLVVVYVPEALRFGLSTQARQAIKDGIAFAADCEDDIVLIKDAIPMRLPDVVKEGKNLSSVDFPFEIRTDVHNYINENITAQTIQGTPPKAMEDKIKAALLFSEDVKSYHDDFSVRSVEAHVVSPDATFPSIPVDPSFLQRKSGSEPRGASYMLRREEP